MCVSESNLWKLSFENNEIFIEEKSESFWNVKIFVGTSPEQDIGRGNTSRLRTRFFIYYVNTSHQVGLYFHEYDNNSPLGLQSVDSTRLCSDRGKVIDNDNNYKLSMSWPRFVCERESSRVREKERRKSCIVGTYPTASK